MREGRRISRIGNHGSTAGNRSDGGTYISGDCRPDGCSHSADSQRAAAGGHPVCIILCWDDGAKFRFAGDCGGVCGNGRSAPGICVFCSAAPVGACGRQRVSAVPDTVSARGLWWRGCEADGADRFFAGMETELVCICCECVFCGGVCAVEAAAKRSGKKQPDSVRAISLSGNGRGIGISLSLFHMEPCSVRQQ